MLLSAGKYNAYTVPGFFVQSFTQINSTQLSIEYIYHLDATNFNISLYKKEENSPIYYQELGNSFDTKTKIEGVEASFDYAFNKLQLFGSLTWLNSKFNKGTGWFTSYNDMDYLLKIALSYYNTKFVNATLNFSHHPGLYYTPVLYSEFNDNVNNYKPIYGALNSNQHKSYSTLDLTINKIFSTNNSTVILFFTLSNIFNWANQEKPIYNLDYTKIEEYWLYQRRLLYFGVQITI